MNVIQSWSGVIPKVNSPSMPIQQKLARWKNDVRTQLVQVMAMYKLGDICFNSGNDKCKLLTQMVLYGPIITHEQINQDPVKGRKPKSKEKANMYLVPQAFQLPEREEDSQ